jgi:hypothetical protein
MAYAGRISLYRDVSKLEDWAELWFEETPKFAATEEVDQQSCLRPGKIADRLRTVFAGFDDFIPIFVLRSSRVDTNAEQPASLEEMLCLPNVLVASGSVSVLEDLNPDEEGVRRPVGKNGQISHVEPARMRGQPLGKLSDRDRREIDSSELEPGLNQRYEVSTVPTAEV